MVETYVSPEIRELGSLESLTLQTFNKVGSTPDTFTAITNGVVVGSLIHTP
jgi:hypothetical protein